MALGNPAWEVRKRAASSRQGVVAAQHWLAAEAGARVLAEGGNAVDAAVVMAAASGVVEPWLSGIGGGGFMLIYLARERRVVGIDFAMVAPRRLDPARYRLAGGVDPDWFRWPAVEWDRNLKGHDSMCVPGAVDGLALALERFGTLSFRDALAPAVALAEEGLPLDWYASLCIAIDAKGLEEFPASRAVFLPEGRPPVAVDRTEVRRLPLGNLARTLRRLAEAGPRDFYEGETARAVASDAAAGGGALDAGDLAAYHARLVEPLTLDYRGVRLHAMPGLSGGPTYLLALSRLAETRRPDAALDADAFVAYASAIHHAYEVRLAEYGHAGTTNDPGCTSHMSVLDAEGNMAALTNTLLSRFGSKVVLPATGVLVNNGLMWFDPRPGRPNSIAPGKRPLANMCPVVATRQGAPQLAIGAAGGRQIVPALVQLTSFLLDHGLTLEEAFHLPRLDASTRTILCNARMPASHVAALARRFPVTRVEDTIYPVSFAVPSAVQYDPATGLGTGMAHVTSPWAAAEGVRL